MTTTTIPSVQAFLDRWSGHAVCHLELYGVGSGPVGSGGGCIEACDGAGRVLASVEFPRLTTAGLDALSLAVLRANHPTVPTR